MKPCYLVDYKRSAFTRAHPVKKEVDPFSETRGDEILSQLINAQIANAKYAPTEIDDLSIGCALPVKEQWSFGGRYPVLLSNIGNQCASRSIDQQCGSGLTAVRFAALNIGSGAADICMAGGYENMSQIPIGPSLYKEGVLTIPQACYRPDSGYAMEVVMNMGLTAENLAQIGHIDRLKMDEFAFASHQKVAEAVKTSFFEDEILAISNHQGLTVDKDGCLRSDTTLDKLSALSSVFKADGMITAGNSSPLSSGAALAVLMSETAVNRYNSQPIARIVACADCGVQPELMGQGVVPAINKALKMAKLSAEQIDCWEINEAFSAVPLYAIHQLKIDPIKVNLKGGAISLGHPLGATGIRLVGTLARILQQEKGRYGCATACIGGGQGIAMIIERL